MSDSGEWVELLILPADVPAGSRVWKLTLAGDGVLGCAVTKTPRGTIVQVSHVVEDVEKQPEGRAPTLEELSDALNRFVPHGRVFGLVIQSIDATPAPRPQANVVQLVEVGRPIARADAGERFPH